MTPILALYWICAAAFTVLLACAAYEAWKRFRGRSQ